MREKINMILDILSLWYQSCPQRLELGNYLIIDGKGAFGLDACMWVWVQLFYSLK